MPCEADVGGSGCLEWGRMEVWFGYPGREVSAVDWRPQGQLKVLGRWCGHRSWRCCGVYWWYWAIVALLWGSIEYWVCGWEGC